MVSCLEVSVVVECVDSASAAAGDDRVFPFSISLVSISMFCQTLHLQ